jgi:hypothetical protein
MIIELIILTAAIIIVYLFLHSAKHIIINTIMGLIILAMTNLVFHMGVTYSIWTILICAMGGVPGAVLVIVFHLLGIAF